MPSEVFLVLLVLFLYFIPSIEATVKRKRNRSAIRILNLLLGWTIVGWIVALVWAATNDAPAPLDEATIRKLVEHQAAPVGVTAPLPIVETPKDTEQSLAKQVPIGLMLVLVAVVVLILIRNF